MRKTYTASVLTDNILSGNFHPNTGMDAKYHQLLCETLWKTGYYGFTLYGYKFANLRSVDDTTIWDHMVSTHIFHMEEQLLKMKHVSLEFGSQINRSKRKMIIVDRAYHKSPEMVRKFRTGMWFSPTYIFGL